MIFDRDDTAYIPDLPGENTNVRCKQCKDDRDAEVVMKPAEKWMPGYVASVWRCPDCGTEVMQGGADNERFLE